MSEEVHATDIDAEQYSYEEVEGIISNKDDPTIHCLTFRALLIGYLFGSIRCCADTILTYHTYHFVLEPIIFSLFAYLLGYFLAHILPRRKWTKWNFSLNPGPFTTKEHALCILMMASSYSALSLQQLDLQRIYFTGMNINHFCAVVYIISTQLLGFGLAGILRRFLVWPPKMVWPGALPTVALIRVLHEDDTKDDPPCYLLSRLKFFRIATGIQFIYSWLPEYIMPVLRRFSFLCMIIPNNKLLAQLTSANGFSMAALQLDWKLLTAYLSSPIIVPRWAQVNILVGFVCLVWAAGPLVFYLNLWDARNLPIRSTDILTPNGSFYPYTAVDDDGYRLNESVYFDYNEKYGPIRVSAMHIINLACHFLFIPALFVHTFLYHGKWIWKQARTSFSNRNNDIHCKLMNRYAETPEWWFILLFVVSLTLLSLASHFCHLLPVQYILLASIIGSLMILPFGILIAETAQTRLIGPIFAYNLLSAIILPSNPVGFDTFIRLIFRVQAQALEFSLYLKISHFMKLPPRAVFFAVISSVVLSSVVAYTTSHFILSYVKDICQSTSINWKCSFPALVYSKTVFLVIIRPSFLFGPQSGIYFPLIWGLLLGAFLPIPAYLLHCYYPNNKYIERIHIPLMLATGFYWYAQSAASIVTWILIGFLCAFALQRWWYRRYALILSVALTLGCSLTNLLVYSIFLNGSITFPVWWGTGGLTRDGCPLGSPPEQSAVYLKIPVL